MNRLSVALCTYNGEAFLDEQLQSYLAQTRQPDELVVRDDGSTDSTVEVLRAFANQAPFPVRILPGGENLGYAKNFEAVIAACTGDLVALSDQDDVWLPEKLARLEAALGDDPGCLFAFSDAALVGAHLQPLGRTMWETIRLVPAVRDRMGTTIGWEVLLRRPLVTGATACFRSSLLQQALPMPLAHWHDAWLALAAALHGRLAPVAEPLVLYRQHGRNAIGAPPPRRGLVGHVHSALSRERSAERRRVARQQYELLGAVQARFALPEQVRDAVGAAVRHHRFRAKPPSFPQRVLAVAREVLSGRYHSYGGRTRSAIYDLIRP